MNRFLKLFTILLLSISILILTGCAEKNEPIDFPQTDNFKTLNRVAYPDTKVKRNEVSENAISALKSFAFETVSEIFQEEAGKNYIYSPLSLYMALSMLLEGVSKETAKLEIENLLGLERTSNRVAMKTVYENNFYKNKNGTLRLANSIWFKNNLPIETEFLSILAEDYYAESYQTKFDSEGHQNIIDWINYYTENFLELTKEKFPVFESTVILLLNTIYFDNKWKVAFDQNETREGEFLTQTGPIKVDYMQHSVLSKYKVYEDFMAAEDYFENNASITYLLPREGINVFDLLNKETLTQALDPSDKKSEKIEFLVPKCKYFSEFNLKENLMNLGINEVFNSRDSLELMSKGQDLYISAVKQNAGIEFSEAGVKAAAVTGVIVDLATEGLYFDLNRPYIFIIKDAFGIPLFIGLVQNPTQE